MSIHILDNYRKNGKVATTRASFVVIPISTIEDIRDTSAVGVYIYLTTKPLEAAVSVDELQRHFRCSYNHLEECLCKLMDLGLINYEL